MKILKYIAGTVMISAVLFLMAAAPANWRGHRSKAYIYELDLGGVALTATQVTNNNLKVGDVIVDTSNDTLYRIYEVDGTPGAMSLSTAGVLTVPSIVSSGGVTGDLPVSGIVSPVGGVAHTVTSVSVTNGQAVAITAGVIELTGIGGTNAAINTITLTTPYAVIDQYVMFRYAGGSNAVLIADSTTVLALGGSITLNATDNMVVYFSSTNTAERVSNADN